MLAEAYSISHSDNYLNDELMDVPLHGSPTENTRTEEPAVMDSIAQGTGPSSGSNAGVSTSLIPRKYISSLSLRPQLQVSVLAPERCSGTSSLGLPTTYTTYLLQTTTSLSSYPSHLCSVRRRYSDFDSLYHVLRTLYAGYFVPKLPDKDFVNGKVVVSEDFVERRAEDLQVFLTRACNHDVLHTSRVCRTHVQVFRYK